MSDGALLQNAASRIFRDFYRNDLLNRSRQQGWCAELWQMLEQTGMTRVSVPERHGGSGGSVVEALEVLRLAGKYCGSVPLAETALLAGWALTETGKAMPEGPLAFAALDRPDQLRLERHGGMWRISGEVSRVAWGRQASATIMLVARSSAGCWLICAPASTYRVRPHANLAGEARDRIVFHEAVLDDGRVCEAPSTVTLESAYQRGGVARAAQMAGALERILEMTAEYTKQRVQFGRPIIRFQAVQQELARLAGEAAIAKAAAMAAASALESGGRAYLASACAKIKVGEAAQSGAAIAHQLHGAIGVTDEYILHHSTLRLWAWRSEWGSETYWAEKLGAYALERGAASVWDDITAP
jgi:acyl-CoA dehydrogenase